MDSTPPTAAELSLSHPDCIPFFLLRLTLPAATTPGASTVADLFGIIVGMSAVVERFILHVLYRPPSLGQKTLGTTIQSPVD